MKFKREAGRRKLRIKNYDFNVQRWRWGRGGSVSRGERAEGKEVKMKKYIAGGKLYLLLFLLLLFGIGARDDVEVAENIPDISNKINQFSFQYLKHACKEAGGKNTILSPQSIYHCLAMSYVASGGNTRKELKDIIHFPGKNDELIKNLSELREQFRKANEHEKLEVTVANSLWIDSTYASFRKSYLEQVEDGFEASLFAIKFADKIAAAGQINAWVMDKTNDRILGIVSPDDFASKSGLGIINEPGLVAVNAVYFKSDWASRFNESDTKERDFFIAPGKKAKTMMMHQESLLHYAENSNFKMLELPYINQLFSMYVVLPKKIISPEEIISTFNLEMFNDLKTDVMTYDVDVLFPKYEIDSQSKTLEILKKMGIKDLFDQNKADLDKMIFKKLEAYRVYINEVRQKAWIKVDEKGTEAAAATASINMTFGCSAPMAMPFAEFHADHPFLYFIVHNESQSILFAGWIKEPVEKF